MLAHLQLLIFRPLSPLEISDPGDEFNNFFTFERRMIVTLDVVLVANFTDEFFAFANAAVMRLTSVIKRRHKKVE